MRKLAGWFLFAFAVKFLAVSVVLGISIFWDFYNFTSVGYIRVVLDFGFAFVGGACFWAWHELIK